MAIPIIFIIVSWNLFFSARIWNSLSLIASFLLSSAPILAAVLTPLIILCMIFLCDGFRRFCHRFLVLFVIVLAIVFLGSLIALYISVIKFYPPYVNMLRMKYGTKCSLEATWSLSVDYYEHFYNTYKSDYPKPQLYPLIQSKDLLAALVRTGSCADFAYGLARLLKDSLGCETRVVAFKSIDHVFPEVKINGTWYVFDLTYTTRDKPVEASKYAEYLHNKCMVEPRFCEVLCAGFKGLVNAVTGEDLRREHGFSILTFILSN